jgi:hypothetical protein
LHHGQLIIQFLQQFCPALLGLALKPLLGLGNNLKLGKVAHFTLLSCGAVRLLLSNVVVFEPYGQPEY